MPIKKEINKNVGGTCRHGLAGSEQHIGWAVFDLEENTE